MQNCQNNLEKGQRWSKAADFKVYYKNTVIQTVYCGHEDRKRDQRNRQRVQKQTLIFIVNWFFWQGCQGNSVGKRIVFFFPPNKWCWDNWIATCKIIKLNHYLTSYAKLTIWITGLKEELNAKNFTSLTRKNRRKSSWC